MIKQVPLEELHKMGKNTIGELLDIRFTAIGPDYIEGTMPVDHRTHQPYGLLHGGASVVLAETLGSVGSHLSVDTDKYQTVGIEINANHIRGVKEGIVKGRATILQKGKSIHVWEIKITDEKDRLVCSSRLTVAVIEKRN